VARCGNLSRRDSSNACVTYEVFESSSPPRVAPQDAGDLGFRLKESEPDVEWAESEHRVGFVRPGGPAEEAGLKVGAKVESVDGHDITKSLFRYSTLTAIEVGASLELGLEGGSTLKITAAKKP